MIDSDKTKEELQKELQQLKVENESLKIKYHNSIIEPNKIEESLNNNGERYRTILQTAMDGFWLTDSQLSFLDVNEAYCRMSGYSREELLKMKVSDVEAIETTEVTAARAKKIFELGEDRFKSQHYRKDGTKFDVEVSIQFRNIDRGWFTVFVRDISEEKKAEQALKESEIKYYEAIEFLPIPIGIVMGDKIVHFNNEFIKTYGYTIDDIQSISQWMERVYPDPIYNEEVIKIWDKDLANAIKNKSITPRREYLITCKDLTKKWVVITTSLVGKQLMSTFEDITERKLTEQNLMESQRKLFTLMSNLPGLAFRCMNDTSWTMSFLSEGCYELTGFYPHELEGSLINSYGNLIHQDDTEMVWIKVQEAINNHTLWQIEYRINTKDDIEKWVWERGCGVYSNTGVLEVLEGFISDISERKKAEQAMQESRKIYETLTETSPVGMWQISPDRRTIFMNSAMRSLLELDSGEDLAGITVESFFTPESLEVMKTEHLKRHQGIHSRYELELIGSCGRRRNVIVFGSPIFSGDGKLTSLIAWLTDITERKWAEEVLRQNEARLNALLSSMKDIIFEIDLNGCFEGYFAQENKSLYAQPDFFIGKIFEEVLPEDVSVLLRQAIVSVTSGNIYEQFEYQITVDNKIQWEHAVITPRYNKLNEFIGVTVVCRNITERKFAERALNSLATNFAGLSGKTFFEAASKHIATEMGIDYVYVGELTEAKDSVRVLGGFALGEAMGEMFYSLSDTPCSDVIENNTCLYPSGIQQQYPKDYLLLQMGIDSYLGSRIYNKNQEPIGLLVALHSKPLNNPDILGNLFNIFSDRIAAELHRIHAYEALHKNETIQRKMVSNIGDVIVIIDKNGINKYKSSNIEKWFGWKPEEVVDKSTWDNVHPDDLLIGQNFISSISSEPNASGSLELRYRKKDDSYCWIEITIVNLLHDPDICGLLGNYHDITERKKAEQAIKESNDYNRQLFSTSKIGLALAKMTGELVDINQAYANIIGYTIEETLQLTYWDITPEKYAEKEQELLISLYENGFYGPYEKEYIHKNGSLIPVVLSGNIIERNGEKYIWSSVEDITERKKAVHELIVAKDIAEENENRFRNYFQLGLLGMAITSPTKGIIDVNDFLCEFLEYPKKELIQKTWIELTHPDDIDLDFSYFNKVLSGELDNYKMDKRYLSKSGKIVHVEMSAAVIRKKDGTVDYFVALINNITERKKNEANLIKLYTAINSSRASIVITNIEGIIEFANPYFTELTGYSEDEYLGKKPRVLKSGIHTVEFYKEMWDTIYSGNTWDGEFCNRKKTGELYWEKSIITPIKNEKEEIINFVAVKSDITNEKKHKYLNDISVEIYEKSEHLTIEEILKYSIELGIQLTNSEIGFFHFVNDDQETISLQAWSAKTMDMCNVPTLDKHYPISKAGVWVDCFYQKSSVIHNDYSSLSHKKGLPEGHATLTRDLSVPVIVENQVVAIFGVGNKKVDYNKIDAEFLSIFAENVWNVVRRKNAETDTITAKEKAEESDKLKTAFLQNMSHEIRTPLNGILGFSNLLQADDLTKEDIKEFTEVIQKSSLRLLETVGNILDISKIETGQIEVINKPFLLNSLMSDIFILFSNIAESNGLNFNYQLFLTNEKSFIESDELKLNQILSNLINNALKFTTEGKVEFGYTMKNSEIEFYVKDTGVGIPEEFIHRIFTRFAQVNLDITRGYEGAGLGLSICKGLVELLDGKIWFESKINIGTTFFFTIPYKPIAIIDSNPENENKIPIIKEKIKILIAEDDWTSFQYIKKLLSNLNCTLLHAENGQQAVDIVKSTPDINLILMDIKMPVMNGKEATKIIKELRPDLPIIAQTAYAFSSERDEILSLGCSGYISKPIQKAELFALLEKYS